ncbi:hypothetical protein Ciccas_011983 [Cichlidogyrus casuarinus]|uniref:Uncharacterized protein n=1 Tax=Cichlidogyrus casuarinus TaxID=1844966 RepID=A0ABD2PUM1_9PLAT
MAMLRPYICKISTFEDAKSLVKAEKWSELSPIVDDLEARRFLMEDYHDLSIEILKNTDKKFPSRLVHSLLYMVARIEFEDNESKQHKFYNDRPFHDALLEYRSQDLFEDEDDILLFMGCLSRGIGYFADKAVKDTRYTPIHGSKLVFAYFFDCFKKVRSLKIFYFALEYLEQINEIHQSEQLTKTIGNFLNKIMELVAECDPSSFADMGGRFIELWKMINVYFIANGLVIERKIANIYNKMLLRTKPRTHCMRIFDFLDPGVSYCRFELLRNSELGNHNCIGNLNPKWPKICLYKEYGREAWLIRLEAYYFHFLQGKAYMTIPNIEFTMMLFKAFDIREELELLLDQIIKNAPNLITHEAEDYRKETTANYFTYD